MPRSDTSLRSDMIRLLGEGLAVGDQTTAICPECRGGSQHAQSSFAIRRVADGLLYNCLRASCGFRGIVSDSAAGASRKRQPSVKVTAYQGTMRLLDEEDHEYLWQRFGLPKSTTSRYRLSALGMYLLPMQSPMGQVAGWVLRRHPWKPWTGLPCPRGVDSGPKTLVYPNSESTPLLHCARTPTADTVDQPLVLVEDVVSADKLAAHGIPAVALLGTYLSADRLEVIRKLTPRHVVLALDADALAQAFSTARLYGQSFPKFTVLPLSMDFKDMASWDMLSLLEGCQ